MGKKHPLDEFLKGLHENDGLKVELISESAIRYSYSHFQHQQLLYLKQLILILSTIQKNKKILDNLSFTNEQNILLRQSLWVNLVISYAKFFTSKGEDEASVPHLQIQASSCYKTANANLLEMHEKLMQVRNKCLAHGVKNDEEHIIPYMYLSIIGNDLVGRLGINAIGPISFSMIDLDLTEQLLNYLEDYLKVRIDRFSDLVYKEYEGISAEVWHDKAIKKEHLDKP